MTDAADANPLRLRRQDSRLVHEVTERVRAMITGGALAPGSRLHQEQLADTLGVSRTPIREALLQLEREGLVVVDPGRGRFVKEVGADELRHVFEARLELEPIAARLGCERATKSERDAISALQRAHERGRRGAPPVDQLERGVELHRALAAPCGNPVLLEFLRTLWAHEDNHRLFHERVRDDAEVGEVVAEHRDVVDAFVAGEGRKVERLMRGHIARRPPTPPTT